MSRNPFQTMLLHNDTPALVMFYAPWCSFSQAHLPVLEEIAVDHFDRFQFIKVNVDRNVADALRYGIRATPTFMFFYKGKVLWKKQGPVSKNELLENISNLLTMEGVY